MGTNGVFNGVKENRVEIFMTEDNKSLMQSVYKPISMVYATGRIDDANKSLHNQT